MKLTLALVSAIVMSEASGLKQRESRIKQREYLYLEPTQNAND